MKASVLTRWALCVGMGCLVVAPVGAQEEPPPEFQVLGPQEREEAVERGPPNVYQVEQDWREIGPMRVQPSAGYSLMYTTGVQGGGTPGGGGGGLGGGGIGGGRRGGDESTFVHSISAGVNLTFYRLLEVRYSPRYRMYSNDAFEDSLDHRINIGLAPGRTLEFKKVTVRFSQSFNTSSDPSAETGGQFDRITANTGVNARYQHSEKTAVEVELSQSIRLSQEETFSDSYEWRNMNWLDYQMLPKTHLAVGVGGGYVMQDQGSRARRTGGDMTFEEARARIRWTPTVKVTFSANGGAEVRQFIDSDRSSRVNPVFGLSGTWTPRSGTQITLSGDRTVRTSYFGGNVREVVRFGSTFTQSFYETYNWRVFADYEMTSYESIVRRGTVNPLRDREDDRFSIGTSVGRSFLQDRASASIFYRYLDNSSNLSGFGFQSNQVGFEVDYRF